MSHASILPRFKEAIISPRQGEVPGAGCIARYVLLLPVLWFDRESMQQSHVYRPQSADCQTSGCLSLGTWVDWTHLTHPIGSICFIRCQSSSRSEVRATPGLEKIIGSKFAHFATCNKDVLMGTSNLISALARYVECIQVQLDLILSDLTVCGLHHAAVPPFSFFSSKRAPYAPLNAHWGGQVPRHNLETFQLWIG